MEGQGDLPKVQCHVLHDITMEGFMRRIAEEKNDKMLTKPFSVTNISCIIDQIDNWKNWFGSIEPYYALKAQNNPVTQRLFHRMGLGYDCASLPEIQSVLSTGCNPNKIIVAHPFKSYHCVAEVIKHRMLTVVDCAQECDKIKSVYHQLKNQTFPYAQSSSPDMSEIETPPILIRIKPSKLAANKVEISFGDKFGVEWSNFEELVLHCKKLKLDVKGISFHPGRRAEDAEPWTETIKFARQCWDIMHSLGYNPSILDIGGGYKGRDNGKGILTKEIGHLIQQSVDKHFHSYGDFPTVVAEPGAFMVGKSTSTATCVMGTKMENGLIPEYHLSVGVFNGLRWYQIDPQYQVELIPLFSKNGIPHDKDHLQNSKFWGVTCAEGDDLGFKKVPKLTEGDWVAYLEIGDYQNEIVTSFNGFPPPEIYYCCEKRHSQTVQLLLADKFQFTDITKTD